MAHAPLARLCPIEKGRDVVVRKLCIAIIALVIAGSAACQSRILRKPIAIATNPTPTSLASNIVVTAFPRPSPTPPTCATLPARAHLEVVPVSNNAVRLSGEGFKPGEKLTVVLKSESSDHSHRIEDQVTEPVAADGCFTVTIKGVFSVPGSMTNTWPNIWQVTLIHGDSAVCRTVTLSSEE